MRDRTRAEGWRSLDRRSRCVLACTLSANALVFFDQTAVTVALPAIGREFGAQLDELQWTITGYLLAMAVFMAVAGRLADHRGRREVFLGGLVVFGLGSALCAVAPTFGLLLAARFVQGIGAAIVQPLALGNTTSAVGDERRGWAIGVLSTGGTALLVLGPLLAGVVLTIGWRWLFVVNLPVVMAALVLGRRYLIPSREPVAQPVGWAGVGLLLAGLAALVVGVVGVADLGSLAIAPIAGGMAVLGLFGWSQRRSRYPVLDFRLFGDRMLAGSVAALFAIQFAVFGVTVSLALYLQHGLGLDALRTGVVIAVAGLGTPLLSIRTGRQADRRGPRALVLPGLVLAAAGLAALGWAAALGGVVALVPGLLALALARPMVFTPASIGPLRTLGTAHRAFAASVVTEARQLGAVLGVALTTTASIAAHGRILVDGDRGLVDGFRAAVFVAAAVCAAAALLVWRWMPACASPGRSGTVPLDDREEPTVASWDDLVSYVRVRYEIMRAQGDELWFNLPTTGDRTQLVVVRKVTGDDGHPWAQIASPVARAADIDLARLLELAGDSVVGGVASTEGVVVFRHSIALEELDLDGFERPFRIVVEIADRLEETLTGADVH
ncbi:MFS transporter [Pseudonocardia hispaniensis]|uniref:MFS transporter n=1 Tax=Pseudonocardia hispaniensis TaxID=904933 RepID=A0ABW1IZF9_9PSEU